MPDPRFTTRPSKPTAPAPAPAAAPSMATATAADAKKPAEFRDTAREVVETVVFVVVLVVLLKTFVAEAFVIPTGSMAETLYGYQFHVTCPSCGHQYPVNCSGEVDPQDQVPRVVTGCSCPNCDLHLSWPPETDVNGRPTGRVAGRPGWAGGDRVLVAKFLYDDNFLWEPNLHDVVVFKYPVHPLQNGVAMNYIKRLEGLPGQTIAIHNGDLYATRKLTYSDTTKYPRTAFVREPNPRAQWPNDAGDLTRPARPEDLWQPQNMFPNADEAIDLFNASRKRAVAGKAEAGDFEIVRRPLAKIDAMKRIVFDNDAQPEDLARLSIPPRWTAEGEKAWTADDADRPRSFTTAGKAGDPLRWLRYRHLITSRSWGWQQAGGWKPTGKPDDPHERHVTNEMGYNSAEPGNPQTDYWVGDLILECSVDVTGSTPEGELVLELVKGYDRFQARFDLAKGGCSLWRMNAGGESKLAESGPEVALARPGTRALRFLNVDRRLTLIVDGKPVFGDGIEYSPPENDGETEADKQPAGVAARGADVKVSHLKLWRDTYYTLNGSRVIPNQASRVWTFYVQPGHFLCLGDNSAESSDSRYWGLVPARLMLGRATSIYYPVYRIRVIK